MIDEQSARTISDLALSQCEILDDLIGGHEPITAAKLTALKSMAFQVGMLSEWASGAYSGIEWVVR